MIRTLALLLMALAPLPALAQDRLAQDRGEPPTRGWVLGTGQDPKLYYQDTLDERPVFIAMIGFRCTQGMLWLEVAGLTAAQQFPQPMMTVVVDGVQREAYPNAIFHAETLPQGGGNRGPVMQNGNRIRWPGTPEYASFEMILGPPFQLLEVLRDGGAPTISFNGQSRTYAPVPHDLGTAFADACEKSPLLRQAR